MLELEINGTRVTASAISLNPYPNLIRSNSPTAEGLEADTLRVTIRGDVGSTDPRDLPYGTSVKVYDGTNSRGNFFLKSVARVGFNMYQIEALSVIGLLITQNHDGGLYTGTTAGAVIASIMGSLPYTIDANVAAEQLYGWLPNTAISNSMNSRDNLQQVLFAIGAFASKAADGTLNFSYNLLDSATNIPDNRIFWGSEGPEKRITATSVSVVEHGYYQSTATQSEEIYNTKGVTVTNQKVVFDKPYYSLTATGLTINSSGPNFAVVSGSGSLNGKPYIHTTRELKRVLDAVSPEKNVAVSRATLVSSANSLSVLNRLANYYENAISRQFDMIVSTEKPGDLIVFNNRYSERRSGYISELSETFTSLDRGQTKVITDWVPTSPGNNYDLSIVLTKDSLSSGRWTVPTRLRGKNGQVVLFSGAQGGQGGWYGETISTRTGSNKTDYYGGRDWYIGGPGEIMDGGSGGAGGNGGSSAARILIFDIASFANTYNVAFGEGGAGGAGGTATRGITSGMRATETEPGDGQPGGDSTWGTFSTANGSSFEGYYVDVTTGDVLTSPGEVGIAGGKGGAGGPSNQYTKVSGTFDYSATGKGQDGSAAEDGSAGGAGANGTNGFEYTRSNFYWPNLPAGTYFIANTGGGGGGGGAAGGTAQAGTAQGPNRYSSSEKDYHYTGVYREYTATYRGWTCPAGGDGADAVTIPNQVLGLGGRGGAGGGGGGGGGQPLGHDAHSSGNYDYFDGRVYGGKGGNGGQGGKGSDGFALIYLKASDLLPSGYTALEYIGASGVNGPRIDTGVNSDAVVTIDAVAEITSKNQVWISRSGTANGLWFGVLTGINKWGANTVSGQYADVAGTTRARSKVLITSGGVSGAVNGVAFSNPRTVTPGQITLCNAPGNNNGVTGSLYRVIMTLDGRTVWCGIPAKNSSNVAGLYDVIGNTFYPSATGTPFTAGPVA